MYIGHSFKYFLVEKCVKIKINTYTKKMHNYNRLKIACKSKIFSSYVQFILHVFPTINLNRPYGRYTFRVFK